ncbi:hypothetical protein MP638_005733 [Amoeboaphelidium occidentale]|nr:hypothetical protein MP638_005733 [Amoeboaphelidium occidentale]
MTDDHTRHERSASDHVQGRVKTIHNKRVSRFTLHRMSSSQLYDDFDLAFPSAWLEEESKPLPEEDVSQSGSISKIVVLINIFLYAVAVYLWNPLMSNHIAELGGTSVDYGYVSGFSSLMQMIGAVYIGSLIDMKGSFLPLVVAFVSLIIGQFTCYLAPNTLLLGLTRIFVLFQQTMLASRAWISAQSDDTARDMGLVSLVYGAGTMVGPALSNLIVKETGSVRGTALASALVSAISLILHLLLVSNAQPKPQEKTKRRKSFMDDASKTWLSLITYANLLKNNKHLQNTFIVKMLTSFAMSLFHTILSLLLVEVYQVPPTQSGFIYSLIGVTIVIAQGAFQVWLYRCRSKMLLVLSCVAMSVSILLMFYTTKITSFLALICPLFASGTIMYSVSIGKLTSGVEKKDQGSILGLDMALTQLQRIIAPLVATRLASDYSLQHVLVLSAIMCSISIIFCLIDTDKDHVKKTD